jgi:hypothetical protein
MEDTEKVMRYPAKETAVKHERIRAWRNSRANRYSRPAEVFDLLPLASFAGAPYSLDETGVVKRVVKAG